VSVRCRHALFDAYHCLFDNRFVLSIVCFYGINLTGRIILRKYSDNVLQTENADILYNYCQLIIIFAQVKMLHGCQLWHLWHLKLLRYSASASASADDFDLRSTVFFVEWVRTC
jgi:hypothetical protein